RGRIPKRRGGLKLQAPSNDGTQTRDDAQTAILIFTEQWPRERAGARQRAPRPFSPPEPPKIRVEFSAASDKTRAHAGFAGAGRLESVAADRHSHWKGGRFR